MLRYNGNLKTYARELRNNLTDAERLLWSKLRRKNLNGYQFYRQQIIGDYIVDFFCPRAKIVIEVDGGQHFSETIGRSDIQRDDYLTNHGLKVLRFTNTEVLNNLDSVITRIMETIAE